MKFQHIMRRLCVAQDPWIWYVHILFLMLFWVNFFTIFCFLRLVLGLLSDVVQVGTQHLNAFNVVALVKLLVDRVSTVC